MSCPGFRLSDTTLETSQMPLTSAREPFAQAAKFVDSPEFLGSAGDPVATQFEAVAVPSAVARGVDRG